MGAYVEHDFERGFMLDEERLRKIHDLIERRISKYPTPLSLRYKVFRGDSLSYETGSVQDVANEDNEDWRAITRLELFATEKDIFDFKLSFSKKGVIVEIRGNDRDAVFLLFSDLREYIRNEILAGRLLARDTARTVSLSLSLLMMMGLLYYVTRTMRCDPHLVSKALSSNDLAEKLNLLIQESTAATPGSRAIIWFAVLMLVPLLGSGAVQAAWNAAFPANVFLFGKRKAAFEKRRRLLSNVFWVIIVGLIVSAVAGVLVWWVTSK